MSNFIKVYKHGQNGLNLGVTTGIGFLDDAIRKTQKKTSIGLAAAPKVGKTTLADFCFVIAPYMQMKKEDRLDDIEWIYFSYEIDRINKEFKFAACFFFIDYSIYKFNYKGKDYEMSQDYLMGRLEHENADGSKEVILVSEEHFTILKEIYERRIIPLFGEYDDDGRKLTSGKITFMEDPDNPTGMYKLLMRYASNNGEFIYEDFEIIGDSGKIEKHSRIAGYNERNPKKFTIIITDHVRKLRYERGFTMKQNIDKWLEYSTWLRNICSFTFVNICHSNRDIATVERLRYMGEKIFPTADDVKDTGNLAEESTILLTLFNPTDVKYNLKKHFGIDLAKNPIYRSLHLAESRYTFCPVHIPLGMYGSVNYFEELRINQ